MALAAKDSQTGQAILPDVGTLSYNGVTFSSLYKSTITGQAVLDNANRTIKQMDYTLVVDGVVTLQAGADSTDATWVNLRRRLDTPGGTLTYSGKGFGPLVVNAPGDSTSRDVAWGPKPKTLEFIPLGGSRAATIRWTVLFSLGEFALQAG